MIGGKAAGAAKPTALGTLLSSGAYGSVLTQAYGTCRMAPMPIWAGFLRKQGHSQKKFKKGSGGPPTYVENIDMFVACNPFSTVLQIWSNQNNTYPLNFIDLKVNANAGGSWHNTISIGDPNFYAVCCVVAEVVVSTGLTFDDYGATGPYVYNDPNATFYFPLWNTAYHGPDITDPPLAKWPCYKWVPADLNVITTSAELILGRIASYIAPNPTRPAGPFDANFYLHVFYAQTTSVTKHQSPLLFNRFFLEPQLGSGVEYAAIPAEQIIYPMYAGVGSTDMDLGSGPAVPNWRFEGQASYAFIPSTLGNGARGDAEFADIIEDIFKSGMIQYGEALGYLPHGLNCNDLPGVVQVNYYTNTAFSNPVAVFYQPNTAGSILIAMMKGGAGGGAPVSVSDTPGANTWTTIYADPTQTVGAFFVNGCNGTTGPNEVDGNTGGSTASEMAILELDPGSNEVDTYNYAYSATASSVTVSITTSGQPSLVLAMAASPAGGPTAPPPGPDWKTVITGLDNPIVYSKIVSAPTFISFTASAGGNPILAVLFAAKTSQPAGTVPYPKTLPNIVDSDSLFNVRQACRCGGLQGSLAMDSQKAASEWLKDLYTSSNAWPVWSGFKLKSIARDEISKIGDGSAANSAYSVETLSGLAGVYWSPTSLGPVANLAESDLIGEKTLVTVARKALVNTDNIFQVQHFDRNNKYNQALTEQPESGTIALFGPRKAAPLVLNNIMDPQVARKIGAIEVRRNTQLRNTYSFKMNARFFFLEAGDLVTINDELMGLSQFPVRILKIEEDDKHELSVEAEQFIYGLHDPNNLLSTQVTTPYDPNSAGVPADINAPIFIEPPLRMCLSGKPELWIVVSDSDPNYGGSIAYASTDGGTTFIPIGQITGNATTGVLTADFPLATDPDTTDTLSVNLTESLGTLLSNTAADEAAFTYPCYLASSPLYELIAILTSTLTTTYNYNVVGSGGNPIRRAVFGMPTAGTGVDHPSTSRFAWLDNRENNTPNGILKIVLDPSWIGTTVYFKFTQFNQFASGFADLSTVTAYTYTPSGVASGTGGTAGSGGGTGGSTGQPNYQIIGGALTNPTSTTIHMAAAEAIFPGSTANYDARTFTISAPSVPTTYYVTIFDPAQTGEGTTPTLSAFCQTSNANVGLPGYVYIGSIVAQPAGGGTETGGGGFPTPVGISFDGV